MSGDNGNGKYPHQEFRIPARDVKGHTERLQLRLQPRHLGLIQKAVGTKRWPYETYADLIRHAVVRHLEWLEKEEPDAGNLFGVVQAINDNMAEEEEHQTLQATYDRVRATFKKNLALGGEMARTKNLQLMADTWHRIENITDPFWREVWEQKFKTEYEAVLKDAPEVRLDEMHDGEWEEDGEGEGV